MKPRITVKICTPQDADFMDAMSAKHGDPVKVTRYYTPQSCVTWNLTPQEASELLDALQNALSVTTA